MKIAVTTCWNETYDPIAEITGPVMEAYCKKHGYDFYGWPRRWHQNADDLVTYGDRMKLQIYKDLYEKYDAIAWIDVDCLITNQEKELPAFREGLPFLWSCDPAGPTSSFLIAHCRPDIHMLMNAIQHRAVWLRSDRAPFGESDQETMRSMMGVEPYVQLHLGCVAGKRLGHCYDYSLYGWSPLYDSMGNWEPGDFIYTCPGFSVEKKVELLREKVA